MGVSRRNATNTPVSVRGADSLTQANSMSTSEGRENMTLEQLLVIAFVGLVAGFLASRLVSGHGYGVVGDIVVGVIGALIGAVILGAFITNYVLVPLGIASGSLVAQIIVAFIGAVILLALLRAFAGSGFGGRRRDGRRSHERRAYGGRRFFGRRSPSRRW
jgi:uncharacterized membrane protein YeaQ/YmgE (transglycosylase-associated protein family)